jgi:serpin B
MKFYLYLILISVILVSCSPASSPSPSPSTGSSGGGPVKADAARISDPDVPLEDQADVVQGINSFAVDLYHQMQPSKPGNWIYSPYSISMAFSMVYAGARGNTESQMADVLHYLAQEAQHPAYNLLDQNITSLGKDDPNNENFKLTVANSTWGQVGFPFEQAYLEILAKHYGAGLETVDFTADPAKVSEQINQWVADKTEDKIKEIFSPQVITEQTRFVLVNAIYFKAAWLFPFEKSATVDGPFTLLDGSQVTVPLMHSVGTRVPYLAGEGYQAVVLPYRGYAVEMILIVPDARRYEQIEQGLSPDLFNQVGTDASDYLVNLTMPKFDFDMDINLKEELSAMGMTDPFGDADFSGIGGGLFITDALHKATITLDEEGTEAAAVTGIAMEESLPPSTDLVIDRPFIFAIVDRESGTILFLGRVIDPAQ